MMFALLLFKAINGWNDQRSIVKNRDGINIDDEEVSVLRFMKEIPDLHFKFDKYEIDQLTQMECALLDCLLKLYWEQLEN
jgi:hypothetical protein